MRFPEDLRYSKSHEWIRADGTVGLSDFAQDSLGDVVHVELPEVGADFAAGDSAAEVESVKAVSDVYAPVAGKVVAVNEDLDGNEENVNKDPYGEGWLYRLEVADAAELDGLMDAAAYGRFVAEQGH
jgi:glycine cleavage system H protein